MTKDAGGAGQRARRKELVTLSVVASAAIALAVTWVGIAAAGGAPVASVALAPLPSTSGAAVVGAAGVPPAAGVLVPAPAAQRQVTVVRRSRAS